MTTHGKQSFTVRGLKPALKLARQRCRDLQAKGTWNLEERKEYESLVDFIGTAKRSIRARSSK